jgi:hypothetical protein
MIDAKLTHFLTVRAVTDPAVRAFAVTIARALVDVRWSKTEHLVACLNQSLYRCTHRLPPQTVRRRSRNSHRSIRSKF